MTHAIALAVLLSVLGTAAEEAQPPEIVFEAAGPFDPQGIHEVVTMDLDGSNRAQRTDDRTNKFLPHFSSDGKRIVYTKFLTGGYGDPSARTAVAVYDLASGTESLIQPSGEAVPFAATPSQPIWSPDGSRIAFGGLGGNGLWVMNADGSGAHLVGQPSGEPDDFIWGDPLWSNDDWIYFVVGQNVAGCFKVRIDRIRPDGTDRTKITDGGPSCTPPGFEQSGDADPGISPDGKTIYSSRGLPLRVPGFPQRTVRHLFAISTEPWTAGKPELDLSAAGKFDCIAGVPKVSPDGGRVLLFLFCPADPSHAGVTLTDTGGSSWSFLAPGFGPDWNPVAKTGSARPVPPVRRPPRPRVVPAR